MAPSRRPEEYIVTAVLATILLLLAVTARASALRFGTSQLEAALIATAIIFFGISLGGMLGFAPRWLTHASAACGVLTLALAIILISGIIPRCGDLVCGYGECTTCQKDCSPQECVDGICSPDETCEDSPDCGCDTLHVCAPRRSGSDAFGCAPVICGDNHCDFLEDREHCCDDCGCQPGFSCRENACFFDKPELQLTPKLYAHAISATTLLGNHRLTNRTGDPHPLVGLTIRTTGYTRDMVVTYEIPGLANGQSGVGFLRPGEAATAFWYLEPDERFLGVLSETQTAVSIAITYKDSQLDEHTTRVLLPITILPRSTLDDYGHVALFATRDFVIPQTVPRSYEGIWEWVRTNMTLNTPRESVQFPRETLLYRRGTQRDIALLLVSAYDVAGLPASLIESVGGAVYVRIETPQGFRLVDTSRVDKPFSSAIVSSSGFRFYNIPLIRRERAFSLITLGDAYIPGRLINATTNFTQTCECNPICITHATAIINVTNGGMVPGSACVISTIIGTYRDEQVFCVHLAAQESQALRHRWQSQGCEKLKDDVIVQAT
jgi:hypothetical protein